jgi:hypothetical protein
MKLPAWVHGEWMSNTQVLAAGCHVLVAFAPAMVLAYLGAALATLRWLSAGTILFGLAKEYGYDAHYELPKQTFAMNTQDFAGYCVGTLLFWLVAYAHTHGLVLP